MQNAILNLVESQQRKAELPDIQIGDTLIVHQRLLDGQKERIQTFEGDLIARSGSGIKETITVRKIVQGEGVERIFPIHSPRIALIEIKKAGRVRRAKLYYIRERVGKATRIKPDHQRQALLDDAAKKASQAAAAAKAAAAAEIQQATEGGISKRKQKRKEKAEKSKKR